VLRIDPGFVPGPAASSGTPILPVTSLREHGIGGDGPWPRHGAIPREEPPFGSAIMSCWLASLLSEMDRSGRRGIARNNQPAGRVGEITWPPGSGHRRSSKAQHSAALELTGVERFEVIAHEGACYKRALTARHPPDSDQWQQEPA
jgi:hypothetical protein